MLSIQLLEESKGFGFDFFVPSHNSLMRRTRKEEICGTDFWNLSMNCIKYYKIIVFIIADL